MVALRMTAICLIYLITAAEPMNNHKVVSFKESGLKDLSLAGANVVGAGKGELKPKLQYPPWKPGAIWNQSRKKPNCDHQKSLPAPDDPPELCGPSSDLGYGEEWVKCCYERNGTSLVHCRANPRVKDIWQCHKFPH